MYQDSSEFENSSDASASPAPVPAREPAPAAPGKSATLRCAYCGKTFLRSQTPVMPFCSRRCQQIDLGMWLTESYGMPYEGDATEPRESSSEWEADD